MSSTLWLSKRFERRRTSLKRSVVFGTVGAPRTVATVAEAATSFNILVFLQGLNARWAAVVQICGPTRRLRTAVPCALRMQHGRASRWIR